ncbi:hypothetical protein EWM58_03190 [Candidatus Erwinia dacicola]|nr:peptide deformylase [Candidatus Erwinia dacicola]NJC99455.1 hypothetical protein [Candidatus Erwinia dacicola]
MHVLQVLHFPDERLRIVAKPVKEVNADIQGNSYELEADGLLAICIQHEMDHLVGKLFIDYLSPMKRQRIRQKLEKHYRQSARD